MGKKDNLPAAAPNFDQLVQKIETAAKTAQHTIAQAMSDAHAATEEAKAQITQAHAANRDGRQIVQTLRQIMGQLDHYTENGAQQIVALVKSKLDAFATEAANGAKETVVTEIHKTTKALEADLERATKRLVDGFEESVKRLTQEFAMNAQRIAREEEHKLLTRLWENYGSGRDTTADHTTGDQGTTEPVSGG